MLLTIRSFTEAGRALAAWLSVEIDKAAREPDTAARASAAGFVALLTPVAKAAFSDLGFESAVLGQQVLGGHGYVCEWGMEQLVRDARIAQIYEGTNGVQVLDLVSRKLTVDEGSLPGRFFDLVRETVPRGETIPCGKKFTDPLRDAVDRLDRLTANLVARMATQSLASGPTLTAHQNGELAVARFFFARILPQTLGLEVIIANGPATLMDIMADAA